jgi:alpha-tubulin suppressor-like RCC1 family protein
MTVVQGLSPNVIETDLSNNVDVTTGTASGPGSVDWTVSGATASIASLGTLPTVAGSLGGTWTPTYSEGSLSFMGAALVWSASGSAIFVDGVTETCGFTQSYSCSLEAGGAKGDGGAKADSATGNATVSISAGSNFSCSVTAHGAVQCWGDDTYGQLGNSTGDSSAVPATVMDLTSGIASVSAGEGTWACAITEGGAVLCWGNNTASGGLGDGLTDVSSAPVTVNGLTSGVTALSVGHGSACAVTAGGSVKCWGDDTYGELGDGSAADSAVDAQAPVACLRGMVCPDAGTPSSPVPVQVTGLTSGATAVSVGNNFACAITARGGVKCWGDNTSGQLGDGSTTSRSVPVQVTGLTSGVTSVSAGGAEGLGFACAVTAGGSVMCWGAYNEGQLGIPSTTGGTPVQVQGIRGATSVSVGGASACAVASGGSVLCWGGDNDGELGNGTMTSANVTENIVRVPVQVSGLTSGVTNVSVGYSSACAATQAGVRWCWGSNFAGQLGNGSIGDSPSPVRVSSK